MMSTTRWRSFELQKIQTWDPSLGLSGVGELRPEIKQSAIRVFLSTVDADITERNPTNSVAMIRIFMVHRLCCVGFDAQVVKIQNQNRISINRKFHFIDTNFHNDFSSFKSFKRTILIGQPMRTSYLMKPNLVVRSSQLLPNKVFFMDQYFNERTRSMKK